MTTPYQRLIAEEIPTGTFGHTLPPQPQETQPRPIPKWTPEEQAQHVADLLEAIDGWHDTTDPRHLRVIHCQPDQTHTDAA
jgi:hypothetical protein